MQNMELAKKTLELLDAAESLEQNNEYSKALESYLKIVLFLIDNNYMLDQVQELQKKIEELKIKVDLEKNHKPEALKAEEMIDKKKNEYYKRNLMGVKPHVDQSIKASSELTKVKKSPGAQSSREEIPKTDIEKSMEARISLPSGKSYDDENIDFSKTKDAPEMIKIEGINQAEIDQLQIEGYSLIDRAKLKEKQGLIEEAIIDYERAIKSLKKAGWSENQLKEIQQSKLTLENDPSRAYSKKYEQKKKLTTKEVDTAKEEFKIEGYVGKKKVDDKAVKIKAFEAKKRREEEIQNKAFSYIDKAKALENDRKFLKAISNYKEAVKLLDSIGWKNQTHKIQVIINELEKKVKDKQIDDKGIEQEIPTPQEFDLKPKTELSIGDISTKRLKEFETKREREKDLQDKAFALLDSAKELEAKRKYSDAITNLEEAKKILNQIGWQTNTASINSYINFIKTKEAKEKEILSVPSEASTTIDFAQREFDKYRKELKEGREEYEEKQAERLKKLESRKIKEKYLETVKLEGFDLIDQAKELTNLLRFDQAINKLKLATQKFKSIGWTNSDDYINSEIKRIEQLKSNYEQEQMRAQLEQTEIIRKKEFEIQLKEKKEKELKKAVGEIEGMSLQVGAMIKDKQKDRLLKAQQDKERLKREAKEFSKSIGKLLNLKKELKKDLDKDSTNKE